MRDNRTARTRARRLVRDGFTLVEVMVATGLLVLVGIIATTLIVNIETTTSKLGRVNEDASAGSVAETTLTKTFRTADSRDGSTSGFVSASPTSATFYTNFFTDAVGAGGADTGPIQVTFALNAAGELHESIVQPSTTRPFTYTAKPTDRIVARNVEATPGYPLFTWYDANDTGTTSTVPLDASGNVTSIGLPTIVRVQTHMSLLGSNAPGARRVKALPLDFSVFMPNLLLLEGQSS